MKILGKCNYSTRGLTMTGSNMPASMLVTRVSVTSGGNVSEITDPTNGEIIGALATGQYTEVNFEGIPFQSGSNGTDLTMALIPFGTVVTYTEANGVSGATGAYLVTNGSYSGTEGQPKSVSITARNWPSCSVS